MGKVAIVTGASRGLGRGIALTLAKEGGYSVYATARNGTALKELSAEASENELGGVVHPYVLDQNDDAAVEQFVSIVSANEGRVDVLVNSSYGGLVAIAPHFGKPFWENRFWQKKCCPTIVLGKCRFLENMIFGFPKIDFSRFGENGIPCTVVVVQKSIWGKSRLWG